MTSTTADTKMCPLCGNFVLGLLRDSLGNVMCKHCWKEIHGPSPDSAAAVWEKLAKDLEERSKKMWPWWR